MATCLRLGLPQISRKRDWAKSTKDLQKQTNVFLSAISHSLNTAKNTLPFKKQNVSLKCGKGINVERAIVIRRKEKWDSGFVVFKVCMYVYMHVCMDVFIYVCMRVCVYACVYVCVCVSYGICICVFGETWRSNH